MKALLQRAARAAESIAHPYATLTGIFLLSRLALWTVRPMDINLSNMHFLDVSFLKHNLLHGLYYMHAQPPLFNLFLGLVLKATPPPYIRIAFTGLYSLMALLLSLGSYRFMEDLQVSRGTRFLMALAVMFFPSTLQGETWLYFSLPVALLLMLTLLSLYRGLTKGGFFAVTYLVLLAVIVLTRSAYHMLVWMVPMTLLLLVLTNKRFGRALSTRLSAWSVILLLIPGALYYRNYKLYGVFQSSTWIGFSAWSQTYYARLDPRHVETLIAEKKITPLARLERYSSAEEYMAYYKENRATGIDLFDQLHTTQGGINYNHYIFPRADMETYHNSIGIIKAYPRDFIKAVLTGVYTFFGFSPYRFFNTAHIWLHPKTSYDFVMVYLVPPLFLAMFLCCVWTFGREIQSEWRRSERDYGRIGTLGFMLFTIAYMTAQTILLVFPEANYIRIPMDPMLLTGFAMAIDHWISPSKRS